MEKYTLRKWEKRHISRTDISSYVTHLTRSKDKLDATDVLLKILNDKKLIGSTNKGFVQGNDSAVCFQDAPISGIAQNVLHEQLNKEELGGKVRYSPSGLMFRKPYIYKKGGRPVIYENKEQARILFPENELWRVVSFDLSNEDSFIDWTHEREWRIKGDLEFTLDQVYVVLSTKQAYKKFIDKADPDILRELAGIITLEAVLK
ncbi:DUF2971 domain-containing protein [Viridibacillus arvi]|uniref:DUF2971 domain-containing protein n=1 Tax=Viridibacillus arvi TaxID=263475 RepID=UPI00382D49AD